MSESEKGNATVASDGRAKPKVDLGAVVDGAVKGLGALKEGVSEHFKDVEFRAESAKRVALDAVRDAVSGAFRDEVANDLFNTWKRAPGSLVGLDNVARFDTDIIPSNSEDYTRTLSFIKHNDDNSANAQLNTDDVAFLVRVKITTKDGNDESTAVAVNYKNEVIGVAD